VICPECEHTVVHTYDTRKLGGGVLRKRKCLSCDFRFYTYELPLSEEQYDELQLRLKETRRDAGSQSETEREEVA
jgi:transcriptional regulator NrdR family protein